VYGSLCRFPGILRVCACDVCVREVCLGGVDVCRWLSGGQARVECVGVSRWRPRVPALAPRPGFAMPRESVDVLGALGALCRRLVLASVPCAYVWVDGDPLGGVALVAHDVDHFKLIRRYDFLDDAPVGDANADQFDCRLVVLRARLVPCLFDELAIRFVSSATRGPLRVAAVVPNFFFLLSLLSLSLLTSKS